MGEAGNETNSMGKGRDHEGPRRNIIENLDLGLCMLADVDDAAGKATSNSQDDKATTDDGCDLLLVFNGKSADGSRAFWKVV